MTSQVFPQIYLEAGFDTAAPVAVAGSFILDDPVNGRLGTGQVADAISWTDITPYVRSLSTNRPATRVQGPLLTYQGATASAVLKNGDGRFDPDNAAGPYVVGGVSSIRAMIPLRIRAVFGGTEYFLFSGFADSWQDDGQNYAGHYAETTVSASDGMKILEGTNLAPLPSPAGDGELSGARVNRILDAAGWFTDHRSIADGDSEMQGTSLGDTALNLLQLTSDSELGELYVNGAGTLVFRNRNAILSESRSTTVQAVFGDQPGTVDPAGAEGPYSQAGRANDDTTLANDIQVTVAGGTMQEAQDAASIATYLFPRTWTQDGILLQSDTEGMYYAQWVLHVSSSAEDRFDTLVISPRRDPGNLFPQVLGREIGDRIQIWRRPPGVGSPVTKDCFVRGIQHVIDVGAGQWVTTWTLQSASRYGSFLVLNDATLGKLNSNSVAF